MTRTDRTLATSPALTAIRDAWLAEGGPQAVQAVRSWLSRQWGKAKRALSAAAREFSPVLLQDVQRPEAVPTPVPPVPEAVPVLPEVVSLTADTYAAPVTVLACDVQRWTPPAAPTAVQRLEAERVAAAEAEPVYRKTAAGRYAAVKHPAEYREAYPEAVLYRRVGAGKAARYHAV
jgi:hypothetical protein